VYIAKYFSGHQIKKKVLAGSCRRTGERRVVYRVLMGNAKVERPLGRYRLLLENVNKMDLQEVESGIWTALRWLLIESGCGKVWRQI
jgi:hypothetical protein